MRVLPASEAMEDSVVRVPVRACSRRSLTVSSAVSGQSPRAGPVISSPRPTMDAAWPAVSAAMRAVVRPVPRGSANERAEPTASVWPPVTSAAPSGTAVGIGDSQG